MTSTPQMMAIVVNTDEKNTLSWQSVKSPKPMQKEVLVGVRATSLNRADLLQKRGLYPVPHGESDILGLEMAGIILEKEASCESPWKVGDRVCALLAGGGYAEQVCVHEDMLLPIPDWMSFEEASSLPEAIYTCYLNLFWEGKLRSGDSAFIQAGASGIGSMAIQICREMGIQCYTSASTEKIEAIQSLGAQKVFDRKEKDIWKVIQKEIPPVDLVFDLVGGEDLNKHCKLLKKDGSLVLIGLLGGTHAEINLAMLLMKRLRIIGSTLRSRSQETKIQLTQEIKTKIWPLVQNQKIKAVVDSVFTIQEAEKAHQKMENSLNVGKIVLSL